MGRHRLSLLPLTESLDHLTESAGKSDFEEPFNVNELLCMCGRAEAGNKVRVGW